MDNKPALTDEERENLVAFLDGELEDDAARNLEARLQLDAEVRHEADALKQAWDLLDYLPRPEVSSTFTNRTLDRIAAVRPSQSVLTPPTRRWARLVRWVAAVLLAFGAGFGVAAVLPAAWSPFAADGGDRDDTSAAYRETFLRHLDDPDLFGSSGGAESDPGRLRDVQRRYLDWLEQLPAADREMILQARNPLERVSMIRVVKLRQWVERQPRPERPLGSAEREKRIGLLRQWRNEDRQHRDDWQVAIRCWEELLQEKPLPARQEDLPVEAQQYIEKMLKPLLSSDEANRLQAARDQWPVYPRTLVELADRYKLKQPGPVGPMRLNDLPPAEHKRFRLVDNTGRPIRIIKESEGKWPEFGITVLSYVKKPAVLPPWAPSHPRDFSPAITEFIEQKLLPRLAEPERAELAAAEGQWPLYPQMLAKLADKYGMVIPETTLPGPADLWDRYRLRKSGGSDYQWELATAVREAIIGGKGK